MITNLIIPFLFETQCIIDKNVVIAQPDYFERFLKQTKKEQQELINHFNKSFIDLNNDIITQSAAKILQASGIHDFSHIQLGPDAPGRFFNHCALAEQYLSDCRFEYHHYTFFVLTTLRSQHAVAVVIDRPEKTIYCIDPQGNQHGAQAEARNMLVTAMELIPRLNNYRLIEPPHLDKPIQMPGDNNCGLYCIALIVGIILKLENITLKQTDLYKNTSLLYPVDITNPKDILTKNKEELWIWLGTILLAYQAHGEDLQLKAKKEAEEKKSSAASSLVSGSGIFSQSSSQQLTPFKDEIGSYLLEITKESKEEPVSQIDFSQWFGNLSNKINNLCKQRKSAQAEIAASDILNIIQCELGKHNQQNQDYSGVIKGICASLIGSQQQESTFRLE